MFSLKCGRQNARNLGLNGEGEALRPEKDLSDRGETRGSSGFGRRGNRKPENQYIVGKP